MSAFSKRHIGPSEDEKSAMLAEIGVSSIDELMELTVPKDIRLKNELRIDTALTEKQYLDHIGELAVKTKYSNLILDWDTVKQTFHQLSSEMCWRTQDGTLHTHLIKQKLHKEDWRHY